MIRVSFMLRWASETRLRRTDMMSVVPRQGDLLHMAFVPEDGVVPPQLELIGVVLSVTWTSAKSVEVVFGG